ncbi:hypothetical protein EV121DRAFT_281695 [Schizophyllum commune]
MPLFSKKNHHTTTTGTHGVGQYDQYGTGATGTHHSVGTGPTHHGAGPTGTHHYGTEDAYEGMGGHTAPHGREYAAEPYGNNVDREGRTLKELGEADRMEEEANIRRQRALAHGTAPGGLGSLALVYTVMCIGGRLAGSGHAQSISGLLLMATLASFPKQGFLLSG